MYADHVPTINGAMRADIGTFKRGVMFAILSARVQFHRVPAQCAELKERKHKANCLWGFKLGAYLHLEDNAEQIWRDACAAHDPIACMIVLTSIPGLGINKAGFVCQMLGHDIACLDTRNVKRAGLNMRAYTAHHKTSLRYPALIARYVAETAGRAQELWDTWCNEVGRDTGLSGHAISLQHVSTIVPARLRACNVAPTRYNAIPF